MKSIDIYHIFLTSASDLNPHRLETFFDAVYAIVMTILVLGLELPSNVGTLTTYQIAGVMYPQLYHFTISFFILAAFWITHHRIFTIVKKINPVIIRLTIFILFITCLLPFTSTLTGDIHADDSAIIFFDLNLLLLGIIFTIQWIYLVKSGLTYPIPDKLYRYLLCRSLIVPFVSLFACILVPFSPSLSSLSFILIFVLQLILLAFRPVPPDEDAYEKYDEPDKSKISDILLSFSDNDRVLSSLSKVSEEMGISKEKLIEKILLRWEDENRVKTGKDAKLCNINPDIN